MANNEKTYINGLDDRNISYTSKQRANAQRGAARQAIIRELPAAELEAYCVPWELVAERGKRAHYEAMNQPELERQAAYDAWAEVELKRRNEELPR